MTLLSYLHVTSERNQNLESLTIWWDTNKWQNWDSNSVPVDNTFNVQSLFIVYDAFANGILFSKDIL